MRFRSLTIEHFKAIGSAQLELREGVNVLYGPNDLGKSTVGLALKSVLLLPAGSTQAEALRSWANPQPPEVTLTFDDDGGTRWRVRKRFGEGRAWLESSSNGVDFVARAQERQVDEKLRELLQWGVEGSARGMAESFVANALLAGQTDVEDVLRSSLEDDAGTSGKLRLMHALAALNDDPLVRRVLDTANDELAKYFTATGRRRATRDAPLTRAVNEVRERERALVEQQRVLQLAHDTQTHVIRLHEAWLEAEARAQAAQRALDEARREEARAEHRAQLHARLLEAQTRLAEVTTLEHKRTEAREALERAKTRAAAAGERLRGAEQALREATEAQTRAERALHRVTSSTAEAERAVEGARLTEARAELTTQRGLLLSRLERAQAGARATALARERSEVSATLETNRASLANAAQSLALARAILHYGAWREAKARVDDAERWRTEARALQAEALTQGTQALTLETRVTQLGAELEAARRALPDTKQRETFRTIHQRHTLAEAALGGGVTVTLRPRGSLRVKRSVDDGQAEESKVDRELALEAQRRVHLAIGDMVELEVVAGAPEKRKDAEHYAKRWRAEVAPVLEAVGVRDLEELDARFEALVQRERALSVLVEQQAEARRTLQSLQQRANALIERANTAPTAAQLEQKRALVGELSLETMEQYFVAGGPAWEADMHATLKSTESAFEQVQREVHAFQSKLTELDATLRTLPTPEPGDLVEVVEAALKENEAALSRVETQRATLEASKGRVVEEARAELERAQSAHRELEETVEALRLQQRQAEAEVAHQLGTASALEAQVHALDGDRRRSHLEAVTREVNALGPAPAANDVPRLQAELERALSEAMEARDASRVAEGTLAGAGGAQAQEHARALEEAVAVARAAERHLETEGAAWRLLSQTITAAQRDDTQGLGAALAVPVSKQFTALTGGRYGPVQFDATLATAGVDVPHAQVAPGVALKGLSVGTRDHLATLIRLAIATELRAPLVLDDHLVHSDLTKLSYFRDALARAAEKTQIIVLTCRPEDYDIEGATALDLTSLLVRSAPPS